MLVTHLQGPHQSVCWLRPKRARHFLGEPGSEHRHAQHEQGEGGGGSDTRGESQWRNEGGCQQVGLVSSSSEEHRQQKGSNEPRVCVQIASDLFVRLRGRRDAKLTFPAPAAVCLHYL